MTTTPATTSDRSDREIETVRHVAALARIALDESELHAHAAQFRRILEHFEVLTGLDVEGVEPSAGARQTSSRPGDLPPERLRDDLPRPSTDRAALLALAPEPIDGFYGVPKTVGGDE